jgi:hypothetical protein
MAGRLRASCDGFDELAAIADPGDADVLEILHGQLGKYLGVDTVVAKRRLVLLQPQARQPRRNVHAALPGVEPFSLAGFKLTRSAARGVLFHRSPQPSAAATATGARADPAATGTAASGTTPAADPAPADRAGAIEPIRHFLSENERRNSAAWPAFPAAVKIARSSSRGNID